jgi:hypothetical protein
MLQQYGAYGAGNDWAAHVALLYGQKYLEAVTQDDHPLVGIRRWGVSSRTNKSFTIWTEAYERADGPADAMLQSPLFSQLVSWVPFVSHLAGKKLVFKLWDIYIQNVAKEVKAKYPDAHISIGRTHNSWHAYPSGTNLRNNPWLKSLPSYEGPSHAGW